MKVVYIDELFLLEGIADALLLWAAGKLTGGCRSIYRILLGAFAGAVYAVLSLVWTPAETILMRIASLLCMLFIAYGGEKKLYRIALAYLAMCAVFAGVTEAVSIAAGRTTARALLFSLGLSLGICALPIRFNGRKGGICKLRLVSEQNEMTLMALCDTGHCLHEPISGEPVLLAGEQELLPLLSLETRKQLLMTEGLPAEQRLSILSGGFRLIPYRSVSGSGFLLGFRILVYHEGENAPQKYWAGISPTPIHTDNGCSALIGPE